MMMGKKLYKCPSNERKPGQVLYPQQMIPHRGAGQVFREGNNPESLVLHHDAGSSEKGIGWLRRGWNHLRHFSQLQSCVFCYQSHELNLVCQACLASLPWIEQCCQRCSYPLEESQSVCGACAHIKEPIEIRCLFRYQSLVRTMIHEFKYTRKLGWGKFLGQLLAGHLESFDWDVQGLIAVPSPNKRIQQRGFNPTMELARVVSTVSGVPLCHSVACGDRSSQTKMNRFQRAKASASSFYLTQAIPMRRVMLIDDVVTTMATVHSLSRLLSMHGVERVTTLALARTVKQS